MQQCEEGNDGCRCSRHALHLLRTCSSTSPPFLPTLVMLRVRDVPTSDTPLGTPSLNCHEKLWVMVRDTRAHTSCGHTTMGEVTGA